MLWIDEARKHIGLQEISGQNHNKTIVSWLRKLNAWWDDDETPWCGLFVAHCINFAGIPLPQYWMRAKVWADWGVKIDQPIPGCIVVFDRQGGGHVGFVEGVDRQGRLMVLGGNQGNKVSVAPFDTTRIIAYVWPKGIEIPCSKLPVIDSKGIQSSAHEA